MCSLLTLSLSLLQKKWFRTLNGLPLIGQNFLLSEDKNLKDCYLIVEQEEI